MGQIDKMIFDNYTKSLARQDFKQAELALKMGKIYKFLVENEGFTDYSEDANVNTNSANKFLEPATFKYFPETRTLVLNGKLIRLTEKENLLFKVLSSSASNIDKVQIIKKEILKNIIGQGRTISDKALRQLIHRLRRKIEPDPSKPTYLLNIYKSGFTFWAKSI